MEQIVLEKEAELLSQMSEYHTPIAGIAQGLTSLWKRYNVLQWEYPECTHLKMALRRCCAVYANEYKLKRTPNYIQCWANVLRMHEQLELHNHSSNEHEISGVYYVNARVSGERTGHTWYHVSEDCDGTWLEVVPKAGCINMFQADLKHYVTPYEEKENARITIAFDVLFRPPKSGHTVIKLRDQPWLFGRWGSAGSPQKK